MANTINCPNCGKANWKYTIERGKMLPREKCDDCGKPLYETTADLLKACGVIADMPCNHRACAK